jgi:predicted O-methyltransferase YrrM
VRDLEPLDNGSYVHPDDPGEPVTDQPRISITDEEGRFLEWAATRKRVLEIGTGLGVSTRWMMHTAAEMHTVDIDEWVWEKVWPDLAMEIVDSENLYFHPSRGSVRGPFDVVFIDGEHSVEQTARDAEFALELCRGLVVVHDAKIPAVMRGLLHVKKDWQVIETTHGLATTWSWT